MWQDAMADLNEQLHVEGIDQENEPAGQRTVRKLNSFLGLNLFHVNLFSG